MKNNEKANLERQMRNISISIVNKIKSLKAVEVRAADKEITIKEIKQLQVRLGKLQKEFDSLTNQASS